MRSAKASWPVGEDFVEQEAADCHEADEAQPVDMGAPPEVVEADTGEVKLGKTPKPISNRVVRMLVIHLLLPALVFAWSQKAS